MTQQQANEEQAGSIATADIDWTKPDEGKLQTFIKNQYAAGKQRRTRWEAGAAKQLAWVRGEQHIDITVDQGVSSLNTSINDVADETIPSAYRMPVTINTLKSNVVQRIALMAAQEISWTVKPRSTDDADVSAAALGTKLLGYQMNHGPGALKTTLYGALWNVFCTGIEFAYVHWDPLGGEHSWFGPADLDAAKDDGDRRRRIDKFKREFAASAGLEVGDLGFDESGRVLLPAGTVQVDWVSGFEITEPVRTKSIPDAEWLIYSRPRSIEWVRGRYSGMEDLQGDESATLFRHEYDMLYGSREDLDAGGNVPQELVLVHELWRPKSLACPDGYLLIAVGNQFKIAHMGPHPYRLGRLPFVKLAELPEQRFRSACSITSMLELQHFRNTNRSSAHVAIRQTIDPTYIVDSGAMLVAGALAGGKPRHFEIAQGRTITPLNQPRFPVESNALDDKARRDMQDIGGIHDSTSGVRESSQQSGKHAAIMERGDARGQSVTRTLLAAAFSEIGEQSLWLWHQFVEEERMVPLVGADYIPDVVAFVGGDLMPGEPDGPYQFNVEVDIGKETDDDEIVRKVDAMTRMGWWSPERASDRERVARLMGDRTHFDVDEETRQRRAARAEHRLIVSAKPETNGSGELPVADGDNHELHIEEHHRWTTQGSFRDAMAEDPGLQQRLRAHVRTHMFQSELNLARAVMIRQQVQQHVMTEFGLPGVPGDPAGQGAPASGGAGSVGQPPARSTQPQAAAATAGPR